MSTVQYIKTNLLVQVYNFIQYFLFYHNKRHRLFYGALKKLLSFFVKTTITCLFVCLLGIPSLYSQHNFNGYWRGTIIKTEYGVVTKFQFELYLVQRGTKVIGRSYVSLGSMYAEMEIEGEIYNGEYLKFQETKIVEYEIEPSLEWCIKKGHLVIKNNFISGVWEGNTTFSVCMPGRIELTRVPPQA